jgi:hypothetical protein
MNLINLIFRIDAGNGFCGIAYILAWPWNALFYIFFVCPTDFYKWANKKLPLAEAEEPEPLISLPPLPGRHIPISVQTSSRQTSGNSDSRIRLFI